jgi:hypothetical protein
MTTGNGSNGRDARKSRTHARWQVEVPVTIIDEAHRTSGHLQFDTHDLSVGGAFLKSTFLFEVDEELVLEFALGERRVRARGRVVRIARGTPPPGMGISFVELEEPDREAIRAFVKPVDS